MVFLIVVAAFTVLAIVLMRLRRSGEQAAALGTMSQKWLAENRASRSRL